MVEKERKGGSKREIKNIKFKNWEKLERLSAENSEWVERD